MFERFAGTVSQVNQICADNLMLKRSILASIALLALLCANDLRAGEESPRWAHGCPGKLRHR